MEEILTKALMVISILIIVTVLLQSNKASDAGQIITGGNSMLLGKTKERGAEKLITRVTYVLGFTFIIISFILTM